MMPRTAINETVRPPLPDTGARRAPRHVDVGLVLLLTAAPLVMGGRHPVGHLVFVALIGVTFIAAMFEGLFDDWSWRQTPAPWLGGLMILIGQVLPLPPALLHSVSPSMSEMLPLWSFADRPQGIGTWQQVSLTPSETTHGLVLFAAYGMLFMLLLRRMRRLDDVHRLLKLVGLATIGLAGIGLLQYVTGTELFVWVYEHPSRSAAGAVKGPFANENHFAHLLALGVGPLLWWVHSVAHVDAPRFSVGDGAATRRSETHRVWLCSGVGIVALAGLLTYSRGGVLVLAFAVVVAVGLLATRSLLSRRSVGYVLAVLIFLAVALGVHGFDTLRGQLGTLQIGRAQDLPETLGRGQIWAADLRAIAASPLFGTGVGSHAAVYPIHFQGVSSVEYTHAESGYLQVLVETGLVGGALLVCAMSMCASWCITGTWHSHGPSQASASIAVAASLSVSVLHSMWDFVWYIPACMTVTIALAAAACRLAQITRSAEPPAPELIHARPFRWWNRGVPVIAVVCAMVWSQFGPALAGVHWDEYQRTRRAMAAAIAEPSESRSVSEQRHWNDRLLRQIENTLRWQPDHARAHLRGAQLNLAQFDLAQQSAVNAMPLSAVRDAAQASPFASPEERSGWLSTVLVEHRGYLERVRHHARRAVRLSPLQGDAYVCWGEVAFLTRHSTEFEGALLEQALVLRPNSGGVLLAAGRAAISRGDVAEGLRHWRRAFAVEPELQIQLFEALRPYVPMELLLAELQPDLAALRRLSAHYDATNQDEIQRPISGRRAGLLEQAARHESGAAAANLWHEAQGVHHALGNSQRAAACAEQAARHAPDDLTIRRACAARLVEAEHLDAALEHLAVCRQHDPDDAQLIDFIATVEQRARGGRTARNDPASGNAPQFR